MSTPGPAIVTRVYDFLLYLLPHLVKFPRSYRFSLGTRLEHSCYDLLSEMVSACYTRERLGQLSQLNIRLEHLRFGLRLCKDLRLLTLQRYEVATGHVNAIGVQLGGWIKQQQQRK